MRSEGQKSLKQLVIEGNTRPVAFRSGSSCVIYRVAGDLHCRNLIRYVPIYTKTFSTQKCVLPTCMLTLTVNLIYAIAVFEEGIYLKSATYTRIPVSKDIAKDTW